MDNKILEIQQGIIDFYDGKRLDAEYDNESYFTALIRDDIEIGLHEILQNEIIESLKNDQDYLDLEDEDEKEDYIDEYNFDRFLELTQGIRENMYDSIVKYFTDLGYECYDGEFFPCNGYFKNLCDGQTAFVK